MRTAICFLTDAKGFHLTEHAAAVAALTQQTVTDIIVFCRDFVPEEQESLTRLGAPLGKNIHYKCLSSDSVKASAARAGTNATGTANMKLFALNELAADYQRALYIDGDVLLMENIDLDKIDFQSRPIAAVYDIVGFEGIRRPAFYQRCAEKGRSPHYFNSGFIAVDYRNWNHTFLSRFDEAFERHKISFDYHDNCPLQDQCVLNIIFENNWTRLPLTFNCQAAAMFTERWKNAAVRHYAGQQKFLPRRRHRSDTLEVALLNKARQALGRPGLGSPGHDWLMRLNGLRHWRYTRRVNRAITAFEKMQAEAFD
ncbi:hypothetical protein EJV44_20390 [Ancylobacter aquaticus]|nr:hypothetical protein EJV44_20390 [Ancylobacter aquaticus]